MPLFKGCLLGVHVSSSISSASFSSSTTPSSSSSSLLSFVSPHKVKLQFLALGHGVGLDKRQLFYLKIYDHLKANEEMVALEPVVAKISKTSSTKREKGKEKVAFGAALRKKSKKTEQINKPRTDLKKLASALEWDQVINAKDKQDYLGKIRSLMHEIKNATSKKFRFVSRFHQH